MKKVNRETQINVLNLFNVVVVDTIDPSFSGSNLEKFDVSLLEKYGVITIPSLRLG